MKKTCLFTLAAVLCFSGQSPRKEVEPIPNAECTTNTVEIQQEAPKKSNERKSAAKRSMEADTSMNQKGAAKRAMEDVGF